MIQSMTISTYHYLTIKLEIAKMMIVQVINVVDTNITTQGKFQ